MRRIYLLIIAAITFISCDPLVHMDAFLINSSTEDLSIDFVAFSWDSSLNKTLEIDAGEVVLFEIYSGYGTYAEPGIQDYESVLIKNQADEILKVYRPDDTGKNIFNLDDYWFSSELCKRIFRYEYSIENEDVE